MGERGDIGGSTKMARRAAESVDSAARWRTPRLVPDLAVIDAWSGQNFQEHGPHTAYLRWLMRQPGDLTRYGPADFNPLIAAVRQAYCRAGGHRASSMRPGDTRNASRQINALALGLCCGWRALDQVKARWLHAWVGSVITGARNGPAVDWSGSREERALDRYCREHAMLRQNEAVETAFRRISAAGMTGIFEQACRFESWRDVEMLLMRTRQSEISLVDEQGYLLEGWKSRFALAFSMRIPEIS